MRKRIFLIFLVVILLAVLTNNKSHSNPVYDKSVEMNACPEKSDFPTGIVSLTFDDGWREIYSNGIPILDRAGIKGTFYVSTRVIQERDGKYFTIQNILTMDKNGQEIASHAVDHKYFSDLKESEIGLQLVESRNYLLRLGVSSVDTFAFPYGKRTESADALLNKLSYIAIRGTNPGLNTRETDTHFLRSYVIENSMTFSSYMKDLVYKTKTEKKWLILVFHQIAEPEYQFYTSPKDLQALVNYLIDQKIPVMPVRDVIKKCYIK